MRARAVQARTAADSRGLERVALALTEASMHALRSRRCTSSVNVNVAGPFAQHGKARDVY